MSESRKIYWPGKVIEGKSKLRKIKHMNKRYKIPYGLFGLIEKNRIECLSSAVNQYLKEKHED